MYIHPMRFRVPDPYIHISIYGSHNPTCTYKAPCIQCRLLWGPYNNCDSSLKDGRRFITELSGQVSLFNMYKCRISEDITDWLRVSLVINKAYAYFDI